MKVSIDVLITVFGLTKKQIKQLKLTPEKIGDDDCYDIDAVIGRCLKTVEKTMIKRHPNASGKGRETLKQEKIEQQIRKLRHENDSTEAGLVEAELAEADHFEKLDIARSIIGDIPDHIREHSPHVSEAALKIIQAEIDAALGQKTLETFNL